MTFIIVCSSLLLAVAGIFGYALSRTKQNEREDIAAKSLYEQRVVELEQDLASGELQPAQAKAAEQDIIRVTLDDDKQVARRKLSTAPTVPSLIVTTLLITLISGVTYYQVGDIDRAFGREPEVATAPPMDEASINQAIDGLRAQLENDPENPEGWMLLGRTMMALGNYAEATTALAKAMELVPNAPGLMLQYADALAMNAGGQLTEQAQQLVHEVLEIEPDNVSALWLAGLGAAERGDNNQSLIFLNRARELTVAAGASTIELDQVIAGLKNAGNIPAANASEGEKDSLEKSVAPPIPVSVELADKFGDIDPADYTLFVFARAVGQGGPPLAVRREPAVSFPFDTALDKSMSMTPQFQLSAGQTLIITARLSKSGQAMPQAGDLVGHSISFQYPEQAPSDEAPLKITIDQTQQ